ARDPARVVMQPATPPRSGRVAPMRWPQPSRFPCARELASMPVESLAMPHSRIRHLFPVLLAFAALLPACNVDEPATFVPRSGTWTFTPDELVSDNCNALLIEPVPATTFLLDHD